MAGLQKGPQVAKPFNVISGLFSFFLQKKLIVECKLHFSSDI